MEPWSETERQTCVSTEPGPAERCEVDDTGRQLRQILGTLNQQQQEVVDLWSEGFSYREISKITDRNESTIRVQVHRALKQIRQHPLVRQLLADAPNMAVES